MPTNPVAAALAAVTLGPAVIVSNLDDDSAAVEGFADPRSSTLD